MKKEIVILIPAYNEGRRIEPVLDVVCSYERKAKVVVIDDGSVDDTKSKAEKYPVEVISHKENRGKGAALQTGIDFAGPADYWVFLDADLINLKHEHIDQLLDPLIEDPKTAMTVGRFVEGRKNVDLVQRFISITNGQRGLSGWLISQLPDLCWCRFGVEVFMTRLTEHWDLPLKTPHLKGITHYGKEEKFGILRGFYYRILMYRECLHAHFVWRNHLGEEDITPKKVSIGH